MGKRSAAEKRAIEESIGGDAPKKIGRPKVSQALTTRWGWVDACWYHRWAESDVGGLKGAGLEPQAETIGGRGTPFWDAGLDWAMRHPGEAMTFDPASGRIKSKGSHSGATDPERKSDKQIDSVKRYRRIHAGMTLLRQTDPKSYAVLCIAAVPKRTDPEIEAAFGQLSDLALRTERMGKAHLKATENQEDPKTLETWLLAPIRRKEQFIGLVREDAEALAASAVAAFESVTERSPELDQSRPKQWEPDQQEKVEKKPEKKTRAPRSSIAGDFSPEGWGRPPPTPKGAERLSLGYAEGYDPEAIGLDELSFEVPK